MVEKKKKEKKAHTKTAQEFAVNKHEKNDTSFWIPTQFVSTG